MKISHAHPDLASNRMLAWLAARADGTARYRELGEACGVGMRGGAVAAACRALERCGWVHVTEPAEYATRKARLGRAEMVVTITPAGRLWAAYVRRHAAQPLSLMETFARMLALEDAVRPLAVVGVKAREAGAKDGDIISTKVPAMYALLAAEVLFPPPGSERTLYPWTPGHIERKHEILGNEQPKK